ncbi:MAG: FeoB-associated Cys-rich membrane protein [Chloroflexi bacterium]|jgi:hypothetical protein|nr:FeoB-associated Cys-rich membrane protein [Chloroflexota bacterium]
MVPTIIISAVLAVIVGLIIYRLICNARSGKSNCADCTYAGSCVAAKILPKRSERGSQTQQESARQE